MDLNEAKEAHADASHFLLYRYVDAKIFGAMQALEWAIAEIELLTADAAFSDTAKAMIHNTGGNILTLNMLSELRNSALLTDAAAEADADGTGSWAEEVG